MHNEFVDELLRLGAGINERDNYGCTPLDYLDAKPAVTSWAMEHRDSLIRKLKDHGAIRGAGSEHVYPLGPGYVR